MNKALFPIWFYGIPIKSNGKQGPSSIFMAKDQGVGLLHEGSLTGCEARLRALHAVNCIFPCLPTLEVFLCLWHYVDLVEPLGQTERVDLFKSHALYLFFVCLYVCVNICNQLLYALTSKRQNRG